MSYSGFTPGLNFGFNPSKVNITNLKYGSPIGGMTNTSPGSFSFEKLTPEAQGLYGFAMGMKQDPVDIEKIMKVMKEQAGIAEGVARRKLGDERISRGIDALAGGLQTALAGGSPEMLAFNAQAPLRAQEAYVRNTQNRQRQELPVIDPQSFMPRIPVKYFS